MLRCWRLAWGGGVVIRRVPNVTAQDNIYLLGWDAYGLSLSQLVKNSRRAAELLACMLSMSLDISLYNLF